MAKKTKREVSYSMGMKTAHCGICVHYFGAGKCSMVAGNIDPAYWCELFKRRIDRDELYQR